MQDFLISPIGDEEKTTIMGQLTHSGLYTDFYELTMAQGYFFEKKAKQRVVFDYFFRRVPFKGGYVIFAGLQDLLEELESFSYDDEAIAFLRSQGFKQEFLDYLKQFRFTGTIYGCKEGEVIFPNEPVLRVEASIIEAQLIETLVLNYLNFQSLIASKTARIVHAAGERPVSDFGLRRAQGLGGLQASRAAFIGGVKSTSNTLAGSMYNIPVSGTMAHSWVQSFASEEEAFHAYASQYPDGSVLLVDTYNTLNSGIPNAIKIAKRLKAEGKSLKAIRLDSGDLAYLSKKARKMLDDEGLNEVSIIASNQLNEYVVQSLLVQHAPIDAFGVGTEMITGRPAAALDGVYKLVQMDEHPVIKRSDNLEKITLPGRKQVFRYTDEQGLFYADAIALEHEEEAPGYMLHPTNFAKQCNLADYKMEPLHHLLMDSGAIVQEKVTLTDIVAFSKQRLSQLPAEHKRLDNPHEYKVGLSKPLKTLRDEMIDKAAH